jgi:hypothetical protein
MIPVGDVTGNQFSKARQLLDVQVVACDSCTYRVPSHTRGEKDHKVQLDDPELPGMLSCTCEAGLMGKPCWAMARVLIAREVMRAANVWVSRGAASAQAGLEMAGGALVPVATATFDAEGNPVLLWGGEPPVAGLLYSIPN